MEGPLSLLVKPSGPDCNLDCTYCFYLGKAARYPEARRHTMAPATLEALLRQVLAPGREVAICFQGGEPTLQGLDFFKRVVQLCQVHGQGQPVSLSLQTNGLHLDPEWARFLRRYQMVVGLSLDGPASVHDMHRRAKSGKPTHAKVEAVARMLFREGVAVNALACVTAHSAPQGAEVYRYLRDLGFDWIQFIPVLETDPQDPGRAAPWSVSPEAYGDFLVEVFEAWKAEFRNGRPVASVRTFEALFAGFAGVRSPECTFTAHCGDYLVVEHNGDLFSCDFFVEDHHHLGNVHTHDLVEVLQGARQAAFGRAKADLDSECQTCPWLNHCHGGCPKDRLRDPRDGGHNHFCRAYRRFLDHAAPTFRSLLP